MFEKFLLFLNSLTMPVPLPWGWFHILCLSLCAAAIGGFAAAKRKGIEIAPNRVFAWYGIVALLLELTKQLMWSVRETDGVVSWSYSWYSAPFQFCTMPMYLCLLLCVIKQENIRSYLYSFLAFFSIISMTLVMFFPTGVFTKYTLINIHTMVLHGGGLIVAFFVLVNRLAVLTLKSVLRGAVVFLALAAVALLLDIFVELSGINHGAEFNMFYISPYYPCYLPVFDRIQKLVPYPLFLFIYLFAVCFGSLVVFGLARVCTLKRNRKPSGETPGWP